MEQAESNPDSLRVFTTERWFVQLGMAACGNASWSSARVSGRIFAAGDNQGQGLSLPFASSDAGNVRVSGPSQASDKESSSGLFHLRVDNWRGWFPTADQRPTNL